MGSPRTDRVRALVAAERLRLAAPEGPNNVLVRLREDEVPPYDALLVIEQLFGLSFNEAKQALAASPEYGPIASRSRSIQDEAEAAAQQLADE
jgi:hypothetical protein